MVPSHFWLELSNATVIAERRGRISATDVAAYFQMMRSLQVTTDVSTSDLADTSIRSLAVAHNLTVYDAAYLELAQRETAQLATLDEALKGAAASAGVKFIG
jgi:predicted nucleic acid-binding protein